MSQRSRQRTDLSPSLATAVYQAALEARALAPAEQETLLDLVRAAAPDPTVFDELEPFIFTSTISTNKIDAYGTRMMPSTLQAFADDATDGRAVMNMHRTGGLFSDGELPIGRSVRGTAVKAGASAIGRVRADAYITPGIHNGSMNSDDAITGIRSGVYRDVSVGFYGGQVYCSICSGRDAPVLMYGRDTPCSHYPGVDYVVRDGADPVTAIGQIENARLAEFSLVYDGACPGAMVEKIERMLDAGQLSRRDYALIGTRHRLPALDTPVFALGRAVAKEDRMTNRNNEVDDADETIPVELAADGESADPVAVDPVVELAAELGAPAGSGADWIRAEFRRLQPLADTGRAYQTSLVDAALADGVRALGTGFAADTYRAVYQTMTPAQLVQVSKDWRAVWDATVTPGRKTTESSGPKPESGRRFVAAAYKS